MGCFRKTFISKIIPLPVPNWASAEEQFIPNYPPQITIYSKFFFENPNFSLSTKFFCHCHTLKLGFAPPKMKLFLASYVYWPPGLCHYQWYSINRYVIPYASNRSFDWSHWEMNMSNSPITNGLFVWLVSLLLRPFHIWLGPSIGNTDKDINSMYYWSPN